MSGPLVAVAVPVKDEEGCLAGCIEALGRQADRQADHIVLLLNNCTDRSTAVARAAATTIRPELHVVEVRLAPAQANAGHARCLAMREAMRLVGDGGIVMTTDADGRVDPDWIQTNLTAIGAGADAVAGWAELDPLDWGSIPVILHEDDARECAYDVVCDELHALLDPDPADPFPRHTQASGASLAVTAAAFREAGGMPDVPCGEDRAFVAALRRVDARIRHAPECRVVVSGRTTGRAAGGMADTIRRRLVAPDPFLDGRLEPALDCARRAALRHLAGAAHSGRIGPGALQAASGLDGATLGGLLRSRYFGAAWSAIESHSPLLRRRPVAVVNLAAEQHRAESLLDRARADPEACRAELLGAARWKRPVHPQDGLPVTGGARG